MDKTKKDWEKERKNGFVVGEVGSVAYCHKLLKGVKQQLLW